MVPLSRGPTPRVLVEYGAPWTQAYVAERVAKPTQRPQSRRYGHAEVRLELRRMSLGKCFYCERKLTEAEEEVDHHVEVAERPDLAFAWANLYLACKPCNSGKAPNTTHPIAACVDPCAPGADPAAHLTFDRERIAPRANSPQGRATIVKYDLHRDELDLARSRALTGFYEALIAVERCVMLDRRGDFNDAERELLRAYADPARPFSLMMVALLRRLGL